METSKAYFEDILRRFDTERRGRTLFQFCRDEGVDYKSLMAYKRTLGTKGKGKVKNAEADTDMEEAVELVELTVIDEIPSAPTRTEPVGRWCRYRYALRREMSYTSTATAPRPLLVCSQN